MPAFTLTRWRERPVYGNHFLFPLLLIGSDCYMDCCWSGGVFTHRIRLLRLRNAICLPRMGREFRRDISRHLIVNKRTQAHTRVQRIRERYPWLSPEDWNLLLNKWDSGWES